MKGKAAAVLAPVFAAGILAAQGPGEAGPRRDASTGALRTLMKSVKRMKGLSGYAFTGEIRFPETAGAEGAPAPPLPFFLGGGRPVGKEVDGRAWAGGLVSFTLDGTEKAFLRGGWILYENGRSHWSLRPGTGPTGAPLWWIPDPSRLLEEILLWKSQVRLARNAALDQRPMRVLQVDLEKQGAREAFLSRLLPDPTRSPDRRAGRRVLILGMGGGKTAVPRDLRYQVLLWVDPATALIHKVHVKAWGKPPRLAAGPVQVRVRGLPPRKAPPAPGKGAGRKEEAFRVDLVLRFRDLGQAPPPEAPRSVLKRLGVPPLPGGSKKDGKSPGR